MNVSAKNMMVGTNQVRFLDFVNNNTELNDAGRSFYAAYADLEYTPNENSRIEADLKLSPNANSIWDFMGIFGSHGNDYAGIVRTRIFETASTSVKAVCCNMRINGDVRCLVPKDEMFGKWHKWTIDCTKSSYSYGAFSIDDIAASGVEFSGWFSRYEGAQSVSIGRICTQTDASTVPNYLIGNVKIYESGQLLKDFKPAELNGTVGFYEAIGQRFYPHSGTKVFTSSDAFV